MHGVVSGLSIVLFGSLMLALHTKLSPLVLDSPFHHCVFCLLQNNHWVLAGFVLMLLGIYISFALGLIGLTNSEAMKKNRILNRIKTVNLYLNAAGFLLMGIPGVRHFFSNSGGF